MVALDLKLIVKCFTCKQQYLIQVNKKDYKDWQGRFGKKRYIQNAFPYLPVEDRELLLSRMCDSCFKKVFLEKEE